MKARVKTGEIVHVRPYSDNSSSVLWKDIYRNITYADCELDFEVNDIYNKGWADGWDEAVKSEIPKIHPKLKGSDPDYWTRLEHTYAGMAMQSYVSNNVYLREIREMCKEPQEMRDFIADLSILLATTLVQKLKGKEE